MPQEYMERSYYYLSKTDITKNIIPDGLFWLDLAAHYLKFGLSKPFLSKRFIYSTKSITEMIMVLAVMDLSFKNSNH